MNEVTIWSSKSAPSNTEVRFTAGEAIDAGWSWSREALPGVLYYTGDLASILKITSSVYHYPMDYLSRYFYFSKEEALQEAKKARPEWVQFHGNLVQECHILPKQYKPVELPVYAELEQGRKGLMCRMNLRPDVFGTHTQGKLYFPDRSCEEGLCIGPIVVTGVKERTNYGFIQCHMRQFEVPSDEAVSNFIISRNLYEGTVKFCSNKFGQFVLIDEVVCLIKQEKEAVICDIRLDKYDSNVVVKETIIGRDLVCQGYQGCSFKELVSKFGRFQYESHQATENTKFISKLFDEAIRYGFVSLKTIHNVDFVEVNKRKLEEAMDQFSREEMDKIITVCSDLNEKANKAIRSKVKNGKIRLDTKRRY